MATHEEYARQPLDKVLDRLRRTPDELAHAIQGRSDDALCRRPAPGSWSAKEVLCHLRDIEELCTLRYHAILSMEEPRVFVVGLTVDDPERWGLLGGAPYPVDAERWAEEREYLRANTEGVLRAFRRRRGEVVALLQVLDPAQWQRTALVPKLGRVHLGRLIFGAAAHDDNHLDQLQRALRGEP